MLSNNSIDMSAKLRKIYRKCVCGDISISDEQERAIRGTLISGETLTLCDLSKSGQTHLQYYKHTRQADDWYHFDVLKSGEAWAYLSALLRMSDIRDAGIHHYVSSYGLYEEVTNI